MANAVAAVLGFLIGIIILQAFPTVHPERSPSVSDIAPEHAVMLPRVEKGVATR